MNRATFFIFNDSTPMPEQTDVLEQLNQTHESNIMEQLTQFAQLNLPLLNAVQQVIQPIDGQGEQIIDEAEFQQIIDDTESIHHEPEVEPITTELPVISGNMDETDFAIIDEWLASRDVSMKRGDILILNYVNCQRKVFIHDGEHIIWLPSQAVPQSMQVVKEFPIRYWAYGDGCYPPIHQVAFDFECFGSEIISNLTFSDGKVRSTFHHNEQAYTAIFECILTSQEEWDDHKGKLIEFLSDSENTSRLMFNHCEYEGSESAEDYVHDEFRLHIFPPDEDWEVIPSGYA